jgi:hypothetical protein
MPNPFLLAAIFILLIVPALYLIFTRKSKGGSGGNRSDEVERPELTGDEQHKQRLP